MSTKMMKKKLRTRKYDRILRRSHINSISRNYYYYINNLYKFKSKKSTIYFSKNKNIFKKIYLNFMFYKLISEINLNSLKLNEDFYKNYLNKNLNNTDTNLIINDINFFQKNTSTLQYSNTFATTFSLNFLFENNLESEFDEKTFDLNKKLIFEYYITFNIK